MEFNNVNYLHSFADGAEQLIYFTFNYLDIVQQRPETKHRASGKATSFSLLTEITAILRVWHPTNKPEFK